MNIWEYLGFWITGLVGIGGSAMCSGPGNRLLYAQSCETRAQSGATPPDSRALILREELPCLNGLWQSIW